MDNIQTSVGVNAVTTGSPENTRHVLELGNLVLLEVKLRPVGKELIACCRAQEGEIRHATACAWGGGVNCTLQEGSKNQQRCWICCLCMQQEGSNNQQQCWICTTSQPVRHELKGRSREGQGQLLTKPGDMSCVARCRAQLGLVQSGAGAAALMNGQFGRTPAACCGAGKETSPSVCTGATVCNPVWQHNPLLGPQCA